MKAENQTVANEELAEFCDGFSRQHEGWLVRMIEREHGQAAKVLVRNLPLEGVTVDTDGHGGRTLLVIVGASQTKHVTHVVRDVEQVELEVGANGAHKALHIATPNGTTLIRFRAAAIPAEVDGV